MDCIAGKYSCAVAGTIKNQKFKPRDRGRSDASDMTRRSSTTNDPDSRIGPPLFDGPPEPLTPENFFQLWEVRPSNFTQFSHIRVTTVHMCQPARSYSRRTTAMATWPKICPIIKSLVESHHLCSGVRHLEAFYRAWSYTCFARLSSTFTPPSTYLQTACWSWSLVWPSAKCTRTW